MLPTARTNWLKLLLIVALALLVAPVSAQTTSATEQAAPSFPLDNLGPYAVGFQVMLLKDASRNGRATSNYVWYPATKPTNPTAQQRSLSQFGWFKASPDSQAAPYPLILISPGWTEPVSDFTAAAILLASHGFVVTGLDHPQEESPLSFVNRPLDVLFALDQLTALNQADFGGIIDTDHAGVMGDSYGAYTTLALTGARIDPVLAAAITAKPMASSDFNDTDPRNVWPDWNWDAVAAYRASLSPLPGDDLWPPFTDPRIHAAVMFSPCWDSMFGERGLAAAAVPSLIIGGTADDICFYQPDAVYAFTHLGSQARYLLTVVKGGHVPDVGEPVVSQLYGAFFDLYLKGKHDEAQYLTADYINSVEAQLKLGLVWGPYTGS